MMVCDICFLSFLYRDGKFLTVSDVFLISESRNHPESARKFRRELDLLGNEK